MEANKFFELSKDDPMAARALLIAMYVRNQMEDFHAENLTDAQMRELNPIIRDAIYTALTCLEVHQHPDQQTRELVATANGILSFQRELLPDYWEEPELTEDFFRSYDIITTSMESEDQE